MTLAGALYTGTVRHRRFAPVANAFRYPLFMVLLDLDEMDEVFRLHPLWSQGRANLASFRREDHLGDPDRTLPEAVRDLVEARLGRRPAGPIRLLTHLRYLGYVFNPVSFYYCFPPGEDEPEAIVAEVHNTPWREEHCYVLDATRARRRGAWLEFGLEKVFHVSPFMGMDQQYVWRFRRPGDRIGVYMQNLERGKRLFDAKLVLRREALTSSSMTRVLVRYPLMTLKVIVAIHFQALRLWRKGAPFHPHPRKIAAAMEAGS